MGIRIGRVALSVPRSVPFRNSSPLGTSIGGQLFERGYVVDGKEQGTTAQTTMDAFEKELLRTGEVYVESDEASVPTGYYSLRGGGSYEKPPARPKGRPWMVDLLSVPYPSITRQSEDDEILGTPTTDFSGDVDEDAYVAYTPAVTEATVLRHGSDLVGAWRLEADGTDSAGLNAAGTVNGAPVFAAAKIGNGMTADGVDDYISIADKPWLSFPSNIFTMEFWWRPNSLTADSGLLGKGAAAQFEYAIFREAAEASGMLRFAAWNLAGSGVYAHSVSMVDTAALRHYIWTANGATSHVYRDGVLVSNATKTPGVDMADGTQPLTLGRGGDASGPVYAAGQLDEPRLYRRYMTASEVLARYNAVSGGVRPANDHEPAHEALNLPTGSWRILARVQPRTTATARVRAVLRDAAGAALVTGAQVTLTPAGAWKDFDLGLFAVPAANHRANYVDILVDDPTNTNPVWLDRLRLAVA